MGVLLGNGTHAGHSRRDTLASLWDRQTGAFLEAE